MSRVGMSCVRLILAIGLVSSAPAQDDFIVEEAIQYLPETLDPHQLYYPDYFRFFFPVYEPLLRCDPTSTVLTIQPNLLVSMPTISEDGLTLLLTFRRGVRFHDDPCFEDGKGREATADDFIATLLRHVDPSSESPFWAPYLSGRIVGLDEARVAAEKSGRFDHQAEIAGLKLDGTHKIEVRLTHPYPQLVALLTMPWLALMPREAIVRYGAGLSERMIGTGPYLHDAKASGPAAMVYRKNPRYWNAAAGGDDGALPRNGGLRYNLVDKAENHEQRFSIGDTVVLDLWAALNFDRFISGIGRLKRTVRPRGSRLMKNDRTWIQYVSFNNSNKFLAKRKVRQALVSAVDRKRWIKKIYKGAASLADHLVPPSLPLLAPRESYPWRFGTKDLTRAKRLLAAAGHEGGKGLPEFVLEAPNAAAETKTQLEWLRDAWKRIGVRVQIRLNPVLADHQKRHRENQNQISMNYWYADYPDPENFFLLLYGGNTPEKVGGSEILNATRFEHRRFDELYEKTCRLAPGPERGKLYGEMIEIVQEECPWIFLLHEQQYYVVPPNVEGYSTRSIYAFPQPYVRRIAPKRRR